MTLLNHFWKSRTSRGLQHRCYIFRVSFRQFNVVIAKKTNKQKKQTKKTHWRLLIRLKVFLTIPRDRLTRICTVPGTCMTDVHLDWQTSVWTFEKEWYQRHGRGYLLLDGITKLCLYPFPWMYQFYFHDKMCCYPFNRVNWEGDLFKVHVTVTEI